MSRVLSEVTCFRYTVRIHTYIHTSHVMKFLNFVRLGPFTRYCVLIRCASKRTRWRAGKYDSLRLHDATETAIFYGCLNLYFAT